MKHQNPLGLIKITTIKGTYILDDISYSAPFSERRLKLLSDWPKEKIYKLKEKVIYLRQLIKYKSGTTFIDNNGTIVKYHKSTKLFKITSHKIEKSKEYGNWTVLYLVGIETPFLVGERLSYNSTHASVMHTDWGIFLYDITNKYHEMYRRKI